MTAQPKKVRRRPLATQLLLGLLIGVLAPIAAVVWVNARDVQRQSLQRETVALQYRAAEAARRVEERVGRLRAYVEHVATNPSIRAAVTDAPGKHGDTLARAKEWDQAHPEIAALLVSVRQANPWFRNVYLLSEAGVCISSSEQGKNPPMVGRVYDYRPYFRAPVDNGEPYVSDVLKNATSQGTGIFVSAPIVAEGKVVAVAVLKVDSFALHDIVSDLSTRAGRALLVDRFGVVVSDALAGRANTAESPTSLQFRPLADVSRYVPRFEETKRYGDRQGDNYLARIADPLDLSELWGEIRTQAPGAAEFSFPSVEGPSVATMVGFSPVWSLSSEPYGYIVLAESSDTFRGPLLALGRDALIRFGLVTAAIIFIAIVVLGRLSRRVQALRESADDGRAAVRSEVPSPGGERPSPSAPARGALVGRLLRRVREPLTRAESALDAVEDPDPVTTIRELVAEGIDQLDGVLLVAPGDPVVVPRRMLVELEPLLTEAVARIRPAAHLHQTNVELEAQDLGEITSDPRKIATLLGALLDNACQYTRRGTVRVAATRDDTGVEIRIADDGIGMTRRQLARVRDPFAAETSEDVPGLGVVIAVRTAELLGGTLELTSDPDRGTVAKLRLPLR